MILLPPITTPKIGPQVEPNVMIRSLVDEAVLNAETTNTSSGPSITVDDDPRDPKYHESFSGQTQLRMDEWTKKLTRECKTHERGAPSVFILRESC